MMSDIYRVSGERVMLVCGGRDLSLHTTAFFVSTASIALPMPRAARNSYNSKKAKLLVHMFFVVSYQVCNAISATQYCNTYVYMSQCKESSKKCVRQTVYYRKTIVKWDTWYSSTTGCFVPPPARVDGIRWMDGCTLGEETRLRK